MSKVLKSYFYRLKYFTLFKVLLILSFVGTLAYIGIYCGTVLYMLTETYGDNIPNSLSLASLTNSTIAYDSTAVLGATLVILIFFLRDIQHNTMRGQLLAGVNRRDIFFASVIFSYIITFAFLIVNVLAVWLMGSCFMGHGSAAIMEKTSDFLLKFLMTLMITLAVPMIAVSSMMMTQSRVGTILILVGIYLWLQITGLLFTMMESGVIGGGSYEFWEFWTGYQNLKSSSTMEDALGLNINIGLDNAYQYVIDSSGSMSSTKVSGRTVPLVLKTVFSKLFVIAGFMTSGLLVFERRDLK
ncbi:MAG: hypothetical protein WCR56_03400 [Bacilli bacterium]|jgi:hypothetical protein